MSRISEGLVEPLDGMVAKFICQPFYSYLRPSHIWSVLSPVHLFILAFFSALVSGLSFYLQLNVIGGIMVFLVIIASWLAWKLASEESSSKFWIVLGSILDRAGEIFIISGIILSSLLRSDVWRVLGIMALIGALNVSYISTRSGREFGRLIWGGFSAYGATRDVRLAILAFSSIFYLTPWGLIFISILCFSVITKRILDMMPLG